MIPGIPERCDVIAGKSQGYTGLPIQRDIIPVDYDGTIVDVVQLTTVWQPTPDELAAIVAGASIKIELWTSGQHPPIKVLTGPLPR